MDMDFIFIILPILSLNLFIILLLLPNNLKLTLQTKCIHGIDLLHFKRQHTGE